MNRNETRGLWNYGTKVYVIRYALVKKSRKRKGRPRFVWTGNSVSRRKFVSRWETFPLDMRLVDIFRCAWSVSRFLRTCILHIYIYIRIYSLRTDKCTRRELDLSFFQLIVVFIFSNPKVICIIYRLPHSLIAYVFVWSKHPFR